MHYLPGEKIVWRTKGNELVLTTHRIRWQTTRWGKKHIVSIMLEEVKSCELHYDSHPTLVVLAVIAAVLGIFGAVMFDERWAIFIVGIGTSAVFFGLFQMTRRLVLIISAGDSAIVVDTGNWGAGIAIELVDKLEEMKDRRYFRALEQGLRTKEVTRSQ